MEIKHEWQHGPEILRISKLDCREAVQELNWLTPILQEPEKTGSAIDKETNRLKKSNKAVYLANVYFQEYAEQCSPCCKIVKQIVDRCEEMKFTPLSAFNYLYSRVETSPLFSAYKNNDYYEAHRDSAKLTLLVWMGDHNFTGGDLYFPDFDLLVPFEPNTGLIFPSHYQHEITKVETEQEGYVRFVVSAFIN